MARLARHHGRQAEARAELAAVCAAFAEGSNIAELIEAREMLSVPG